MRLVLLRPLERDPPARACALARHAGFDALALATDRARPPAGEELAAWLRALLESGVALAGFYRPLGHAGAALLGGEDELSRRRFGNQLRALAEVVGELGGSWLGLDLPLGPDLPPGGEAAMLSRMVQELRRVAAEAARHRVRLLLAALGGVRDGEALAELVAAARAVDGAALLVEAPALSAAAELPGDHPLVVRLVEADGDSLTTTLPRLWARGRDCELLVSPPGEGDEAVLVAAHLAGFIRGLEARRP